MMEESEQFMLEVEKLMTSEVATTLWATNMDLLALTTFDNLVELYRISYKAQRVFQSDEGKPIKGLAFSPDSQMLAYGLIDGTIKIVKTENGERVVVVEGVISAEIVGLSFLNYQTLQSTHFLPFQKGSMESKLILNICPHKNCNRNAIIKINYFNEMRREFSLLLSSQRTKTLLLLNGFLPIAEIDYSRLPLTNPVVLHTHYDGTLRAILADESEKRSVLYLAQYEATVLSNSKQHLIKFNCLLGYVSEILAFVQIAYDHAQLTVRDILRQYNSKINLIDDPNVENLNPCEELFRFLNCGTTSTAVVNFFTKEVYDTKILEKLDQTLNGCFAQLHDLLLESIQNSLQRATLLLKRLQQLAEVNQVAALSVDPRKITKVQQRIVKLYTMGEVLLTESTEAKFDIRNLLVWLNKSTIKSAGENEVEIENTKSYLNKYTVDFNRLYAFLNEERKFKLNNLLAYFSKNPNDSTSLRLQQPDFRLLSPPHKQTPTPFQAAAFTALLQKFDVQDVDGERDSPMEIEESYRSFKVEVKEVSGELKAVGRQPLETVSALLNKQPKLTRIGEVEVSELFAFQLRTVVRQGQLLAYYVQREQSLDRLIEYNCHQHTRSSLTSTLSHITSIAAADKVIIALENKLTTQRIIGEVANEAMDGAEIEIGRRISKIDGEPEVDCSFRGLNSVVIGRTKLIIFD